MGFENIVHTAFFAGLFGVMLVMLSFNVLRRRVRCVVRGMNHDQDLEKSIRIQGNFVEYVPTILILFLIMELAGAPEVALNALGGILFFARVFHAHGMTIDNTNNVYRVVGIHGTFIVLLVSSFACLLFALKASF